ncbi:MAG: hypothetical protein QOE42_558 [Chloroflexota bacterium]|nr:hypothetical protein [Chloroflexota bacterium]
MDRMNAGERPFAATPPVAPDAIDILPFSHRRRRVGWPELNDEMCAVAGRGLYRGYGAEELSTIGIGFGLFQMPGLAALVAQVVAEDVERRRRSAAALQASLASADSQLGAIVASDGAADHAVSSPPRNVPEPVDTGTPDHGPLRLAVAAGA